MTGREPTRGSQSIPMPYLGSGKRQQMNSTRLLAQVRNTGNTIDVGPIYDR